MPPLCLYTHQTSARAHTQTSKHAYARTYTTTRVLRAIHTINTLSSVDPFMQLQQQHHTRTHTHTCTHSLATQNTDELFYQGKQMPEAWHTHARTHTHTHKRTHRHTHTHALFFTPRIWTSFAKANRCFKPRHTHIHTHTHTHKLTHRPTGTHTHTYRHTDTQTHTHTHSVFPPEYGRPLLPRQADARSCCAVL